MVLTIKHDEKFQKFYVNIDGKQCWLKYKFINKYIVDFETLFIPRSMRGLGLARKILEYAVSFAEKKRMKIQASCSYVRQFFDRNANMQEVLYHKITDFRPILNYN